MTLGETGAGRGVRGEWSERLELDKGGKLLVCNRSLLTWCHLIAK